MARNDQVSRILKVLHYLEVQPQGLTTAQIHNKLKSDDFVVDRRTVPRDLDALQKANIPLISEEVGQQHVWKLAPFAEIKKNVTFTYREIFALFIGRKALEHLRGGPIYEALTQFFEKIEKLLGSNCEAFDEFLNNIAFKAQPTWQNSVSSVLLDTVYTALEEGHPLKIQYRAESGDAKGEYKERVVGPECLYFADGGVYLIAVNLSKKEVRHYALARMREAEVMVSDTYDKSGINPQALFKDSFGLYNTGGTAQEVEILLAGPTASYFAERKWHQSQRVVKTTDGYLLSLNVRINDEFIRWILSLGSGATIMRPNFLCEMVLNAVQEIGKKYRLATVA